MPIQFNLLDLDKIPDLSREELLQQIKKRLEEMQPWSYNHHALSLCKKLMEKGNAVDEQDIQELLNLAKTHPKRRLAYSSAELNSSVTLFFNNKPTIIEVLIRHTLNFLKNQREKMCVIEVSL